MKGYLVKDSAMDSLEGFEGRTSEKGVVLVVALFILLILTAIGLSASDTSIFEQKMSTNMLDQNTAFQSAESGLRAGELYLEGLAALNTGTAGCNASSAPCVSVIGTVNGGDFSGTFPWQDIYTFAIPGFPASGAGKVSAPPEYIVEYITNLPDTNSSLGIGTGGTVPGSDFYRVTARGTGRTAVAHAIVQSVYARRF